MDCVRRGRLFVVSGPSGTGKGALCSGLVLGGRASLSVSMTTRAPRAHEVEGESYFFVGRERFLEMTRAGGFFEWAEVYGEYYGTPKAPVMERLSAGIDVILEIEMQGAAQIKGCVPDAVLVFVLPPSPGELRRRIEGRGTEPPEAIAYRLSQAESEIALLGQYDYCVVNDELDGAVRTVRAIMAAERCRVGADAERIVECYRKGFAK